MRRIRGAFPAVALLLLLPGCSELKQFPTGHWRATNAAGAILVMNWDSSGAWTAKTAASSPATLEDLSSGTFSSTESTLPYKTDTYCLATEGSQEGTYAWTVKDDKLTLTMTQDDCQARRALLDGVTVDPLD